MTAETLGPGIVKTSTAKDNAGNTGTGSVTVRLDKTAPTVTASADRAANGAGWYNDDVIVSFSATDPLSGIDNAPVRQGPRRGREPVRDGHRHRPCGNEGNVTLSGINVDKTAPTLSAAATSSPNAAGWYSGPVTVKWTAADALSGLAAPAPADTVLSTEGANQSVTKTVADKAGNTKSAASPAISIDATAPNTSAVRPERLDGRRPDRSRSSRTTACRACSDRSSSTAMRQRAARRRHRRQRYAHARVLERRQGRATRRRTRPSRSRSTAARRRSRTR